MGGVLWGNALPSALSALVFAHTASDNAELFSYETKKGG